MVSSSLGADHVNGSNPSTSVNGLPPETAAYRTLASTVTGLPGVAPTSSLSSWTEMVRVWEPASSDTVTRLSAPESLFTGPGRIGIGWLLSSSSSMNHTETGDPVRSWVYPSEVSSAIGTPFRLAAQRLAAALGLRGRKLRPDREVVSVGRDG